jgi:YVTN family beta-propeller protein
MGRRLALLIATYQYQDSGLRQLVAPAHDAESLAHVLRDPDIAGFEVTTLVNQPHHVVGEAIGDFYRDRRRDDLTLLYFTGHGLKDDDGRLYLAMANTRRDGLLFTSLSAEQIDRAMESCPSRQKVLILDCCYSGAYPTGRLAKADDQVHALERFQGRGRTVLTASDATQYAFEGNQLHGDAAQSVFTRHLVAGIRDGSADLDGDGDITIDELYSYVYDRVVEDMPQQRPKKQDNVQGRTVIARNVNWSMPAYLTNAIRSPIATDRLGAVDALAHLYRVGNELVRARTLDEVRRLADDDSRMVSAAAAAQMRAIVPQPSPPAPPAEEPEPAVEPEPESPVGRAPEPEVEPVPEPVAELSAASGGRTRRLPRRNLLGLAAGVLPVLAAAVLVAGMLLQDLAYGGAEVEGYASYHPRYAVGLAAVAVVAGVFILVPRTRAVVGPGLVLGAAAASAWGLAFYIGKVVLVAEDWTAWIEIAGHASLIAAAILALLGLRRNGVARIEFRLPGDRLGWLAVALCGVGAVAGAAALAGEVHHLSRLAAQFQDFPPVTQVANHARAYVVATVLALTTPLWAAVVAPRRLGISMLAGWIGGGAAIALTTGRRLPDISGWDFDRYESRPGWAVIFAGALLLLMAATALAVRSSASTRAVARSGRQRRALLAGLATLSMLAAAGGVVITRVADPLVSTEVRTYDVAVGPDSSRVYAATWLVPWGSLQPEGPVPGQVTVIDTASDSVVGAPIPVGDRPADIAVSPDGDYVYVANFSSASVSVISTLENATVGEPIPVGDGPALVYVRSDGQRAYVVNSGPGTVSVIDTEANQVVGAPIPLGDDAGITAVSPDGRRIYTTNGGAEDGPYRVSVIDTGTGEAIGDPIPLSDRPAAMVVSPDGRRVYIGTSTDDPAEPERVWVLDTETNQLAGTPIPVGTGVFSDMAISPDGGRLYVVGFFNGLSVIDTRTRATIGDPVDIAGGGMAVSPDGRRVYAAGLENLVWFFDTADPGTVTAIEVETP